MTKLIVKEAEMKLLEMLQTVHGEAMSWRAVLFRFSSLLEHYRSDYQIKIAFNLMSALLKETPSSVFICSDSDLVLLCQGANKTLLEKMVFQLRYLFLDDPLAYSMDGQENPEFSDIYDLSIDWKKIVKIIKDKNIAATKNEPAKPSPQETSSMEHTASVSASGGKQLIKPLTPSRLSMIEKDLITADLSRVLRKQPICAASPGKNIRRVYDEIYINIGHLRGLVMADVDLTSNPWLFRYLTQVLDEKMLDLLRRNPARYFDVPVSLNLNISTLLSEKFAEFDAMIKPSIKVSIVVEVQVSDVLEDIRAFMAAKELIQKAGYRICLDGLNALSFPLLERDKVGFDLAKLQWNASSVGELDSEENKTVAKAVERCGSGRVILCRCDSRQAIEYGHAMGISLFQGRFLDKVINPNAKVEN